MQPAGVARMMAVIMMDTLKSKLRLALMKAAEISGSVVGCFEYIVWQWYIDVFSGKDVALEVRGTWQRNNVTVKKRFRRNWRTGWGLKQSSAIQPWTCWKWWSGWTMIFYHPCIFLRATTIHLSPAPLTGGECFLWDLTIPSIGRCMLMDTRDLISLRSEKHSSRKSMPWRAVTNHHQHALMVFHIIL